jgi:hypothetical protein
MIPSGTARTYWIYVAMTGIVAIGLWAILGYGTRRLQAPPDISGSWTLLDERELEVGNVRIVQSGLFLRLYWPGRDPVGLRMAELSEGRDRFMLVNHAQAYSVSLAADRQALQWVDGTTDTVSLLRRPVPATARRDAR